MGGIRTGRNHRAVSCARGSYALRGKARREVARQGVGQRQLNPGRTVRSIGALFWRAIFLGPNWLTRSGFEFPLKFFARYNARNPYTSLEQRNNCGVAYVPFGPTMIGNFRQVQQWQPRPIADAANGYFFRSPSSLKDSGPTRRNSRKTRKPLS